jgi:hypothetical protein
LGALVPQVLYSERHLTGDAPDLLKITLGSGGE